MVLQYYTILNHKIESKYLSLKGEESMGKRFIMIDKEGLMEGTRIIVDTETGVQYLLAHWTNIGGLTVLVDQDGKPLLDKRYVK